MSNGMLWKGEHGLHLVRPNNTEQNLRAICDILDVEPGDNYFGLSAQVLLDNFSLDGLEQGLERFDQMPNSDYSFLSPRKGQLIEHLPYEQNISLIANERGLVANPSRLLPAYITTWKQDSDRSPVDLYGIAVPELTRKGIVVSSEADLGGTQYGISLHVTRPGESEENE